MQCCRGHVQDIFSSQERDWLMQKQKKTSLKDVGSDASTGASCPRKINVSDNTSGVRPSVCWPFIEWEQLHMPRVHWKTGDWHVSHYVVGLYKAHHLTMPKSGSTRPLHQLHKCTGKGENVRFIYFQFTELKVFERVNTCTQNEKKRKK